MKNFILLLAFLLAGALVLTGCDREDDHHPPHVSRSCDAVAADENDHVIAAINSSGTFGHVVPYGSLDDSPVPPDYSADVWRYDQFGRRRSGRDFWSNGGPFAMMEVKGIRPLPGFHTLVAGNGGELVSAVVDSSFQFERAQNWGIAYSDAMVSVPVGDGLACLYVDPSPGVLWRLAFLDADGNLRYPAQAIDAPSLYPPKLASRSNGNVVVIDGSSVTEYAPLLPVPQWGLVSPTRHFTAGGEDVNGNLKIFGMFTADSLSNQLTVVTGTADTVLFQTCHISGGAIEEISAAARAADSTWLLACVSSPSNDFCLVLYDGTDTARVVSNWVPEGDPVTTCAATGSNGWVVFGGYIRFPGGAYRRDAFVRTYTRAGLGQWVDIIEGL